jgi:hypothetical protein
MTKQISDTVEAKLVADLLVGVVEQLIVDGDIDARGKSAAELREALHKWYASQGPAGVEFQSVLDHTPTIWTKAKKAEATDDLQYACLYYATWAEHRLNQIIAALCRRRGYEEEFAGILIRDTGFKAKLLWVQCLLRRKHKKRFFDALVSLAELRNQMLHYKWKPSDNGADRQQRSALRRAKPALRYLDHILNLRLMAGSKTQISRLRREIASSFKENSLLLNVPNHDT